MSFFGVRPSNVVLSATMPAGQAWGADHVDPPFSLTVTPSFPVTMSRPLDAGSTWMFGSADRLTCAHDEPSGVQRFMLSVPLTTS